MLGIWLHAPLTTLVSRDHVLQLRVQEPGEGRMLEQPPGGLTRGGDFTALTPGTACDSREAKSERVLGSKNRQTDEDDANSKVGS